MTIGKKEEGIIQILIAVVFMVGAFFVSTRLEFLGNYGYLGAFVISLVSAATVLLPVPAINWQGLFKIIGHKWVPGANLPFDPMAGKLAKKNQIKVIITNGKNLKNLKNILEN
jgi:hypothetical protein